jgi:hypothetical protein
MVKEATLTVLAIVRQNVYAVLAGSFFLVAVPCFLRLLEILKNAQGK